MADEQQLAILMQGVRAWNAWRTEHASVKPDLSGEELMGAFLSEANLSEANLDGTSLDKADLHAADLTYAFLGGSYLDKADLRGADLTGANLSRAALGEADLDGAVLDAADLTEADLRDAHMNGAAMNYADLTNANLSGAKLRAAILRKAHLFRTQFGESDLNGACLSGAYLGSADLHFADLTNADLSEAYLGGADLSGAKLYAADLKGANLHGATLVETNFSSADLSDCAVYGVSTWNVELNGATQRNLSITAPGEPIITVDNLEVAQFLYLMLHNAKIRDIIDTLTSKVVLILGRFTESRKPVLDAIREELRQHNYAPVLFDFEGPSDRDVVETVTLLARMARFIVADLTDAAMVRTELALIVRDLPSVPVQPLLQQASREFVEYTHIRQFPWVLPIYRYLDMPTLMSELQQQVIAPVEAKVIEIRERR